MDAEKIALQEDQSRAIRELSLEERGRLLVSACRAAAIIERGRLASGLPPSQPAPWPDSTWALLKKYAPNGQQRQADE